MKKLFATSILLSMLITLLFWPGALSAQSKNVVAGTVGKVSVNKNSSIEIIEPYLVQWGKNNVLSFKVRLYNGGGAPLDLLRYGITVKTNAGNPGNAIQVKESQTNTKVLPQSSRDFTFYATVPNQTQLTSVQFDVKEWNIAYAGFSKSMGTIKIPSNYSNIVASGDSKISVLQNNQIRISLSDFFSYETANDRMYTLTLLDESWGTQPVELPKYSYWLQAESGDLYPLQTDGSDDGILNPKEKAAFDLYATIPKASKAKNFKLLLTTTENSLNLTLHAFKLAQARAWTSVPVNMEKGHYIRPDEDQFSLQVDPLYITETDLPQMDVGTTIILKNNNKLSVVTPSLAYFVEVNHITYVLTPSDTTTEKRLEALEQLKVSLSADMPKSLSKYNMNLIIAKVLSGDEHPVYKPLLKIPLNKAAEVEQTKVDSITKTALKDGSPYSISVSNVMGYMDGKYQIVEGTITLTNDGQQKIELPEFKLKGSVDQKYSYEGTLTDTQTVNGLSPQDQMSQTFQVQLPKNAGLQDFKLSLEEPFLQGNDKLYRPVASFSLQGLQNSQMTAKDWVYFSTKNGDFKIKRISTYRLPVDGEDAVVTEFELYSSSRQNETLPEFKAAYTVNHTSIEAQQLVLDKVISTSPDTAISLQVIGKVPYSMSTGEVNMLLKVNEDGAERSIGQFLIDSMDTVPQYDANDIYSLKIAGRESETQLYKVLVYPGMSEDLVEVQMIQRNNNKRTLVHNPLYGYFQSKDGSYYPLDYETNAEQNVKYGSVSIQSLAGKVPKGTNLADLKLLFGLAINDKEIAGTSGNAGSFVRPAFFTLVEDTGTAAAGLIGMNVGPYSLDISNPQTKLVSGYNGTMEFTASLTKQLSFDSFDTEHKIIIQLENAGEIITTKEYGLNTAEDTSSFTLLSRKYKIEGISTNLTTPSLQVKVYLSYKGEKKLIGEQVVGVSFQK
ncbi:hypothetical protein GC101_15490 [Paenibacillus sp. LMG 31459]|uniref:Uncharacterized protein n=1 Tax=Paenibacillus phytohabitans TaxID=2654978 RepID=A0ABX1YK70_9BACL|nr:hypothetical protein [Paenibacillus phytohabitans]NOU80273.1 hypothetical protein [Paenibacillus phytohabitans]